MQTFQGYFTSYLVFHYCFCDIKNPIWGYGFPRNTFLANFQWCIFHNAKLSYYFSIKSFHCECSRITEKLNKIGLDVGKRTKRNILFLSSILWRFHSVSFKIFSYRVLHSNFQTFSARTCQISLPRSWKTMHYTYRYLGRSWKKMSDLARDAWILKVTWKKMSDLGGILEEKAWSWKSLGRNCLNFESKLEKECKLFTASAKHR